MGWAWNRDGGVAFRCRWTGWGGGSVGVLQGEQQAPQAAVLEVGGSWPSEEELLFRLWRPRLPYRERLWPSSSGLEEGPPGKARRLVSPGAGAGAGCGPWSGAVPSPLQGPWGLARPPAASATRPVQSVALAAGRSFGSHRKVGSLGQASGGGRFRVSCDSRLHSARAVSGGHFGVRLGWV